MCESSKLGSWGSPATHLPLALSQLLHFMLLGLQDLLYLGTEGQVPGVTLGSRVVLVPILQNWRPSRAGPALPTLHSYPGLRCRVQHILARRGPGQLPWLRPRL